MQTIKRINGAEDDLGFEVDLRDYGKTLADVLDIFFVIKDNKTDADDSLFLKKQSLGEITATGIDELTVAVEWATNEYSQFVIDKVYVAGLFIQFIGQTIADENIDQIFHLVIEQDFLIDN